MPSDAIAKRLETVEMTVEGLTGLPGQVASLNTRVASLDTRVASLDTRVASLEVQFLQFRDEVRGEFSVLRTEIRAGDEETRVQMRVLHEEVLDRISKLGESRPVPSPGRRGESPRRRHPKKWK